VEERRGVEKKRNGSVEIKCAMLAIPNQMDDMSTAQNHFKHS
jgi:hypothetical protein